MMSADAYRAYGHYANNYFCEYGYNMFGAPAQQQQVYAGENYHMQGYVCTKPPTTPVTSTSAATGASSMHFNLDDFSDADSEVKSPSNGSTTSSGGNSSLSRLVSSDSESSDEERASSVNENDVERSREFWRRQQALLAALERAKAWCEPEDKSHQEKPMRINQLLQWRNQANAWPQYGLGGTSYACFKIEDSQPQPAKTASPKMRSSKPPPAQKQAVKKKRQEKPNRALPEMTLRSGSDIATSGSADAAIKVSENSWAAQQRARREQRMAASDPDEQVSRKIKGILNKLTLEKFEQLKDKLLTCGITSTTHVKILIRELFDKAITQHHFIDMYADLCVLLDEHFSSTPLDNDDADFSFKRSLLQECQTSFERYLAPPPTLGEMDPEDRCIAEARYKLCMLGNIRLIGAMLARKMLNPKVMVGIIEELLGNPTPEALEMLAALLTVVGSTFDCEGCQQKPILSHVFDRISSIVKTRSCQPRERCLLQDVIDLRTAGWKDHRPKKMERPTTLDEVAQRRAAEEDPFAALRGSGKNQPKKQPHRVGLQQEPKQPQQQQLQQMLLKQQLERLAQLKEQQEQEEKKKRSFDQETFRSESRKALRELRYSNDIEEAKARFVALTPPPAGQQIEEITELLSSVSEESTADARSNGFKVLTSLFDSASFANAAGSIASAIAPWRSDYFGEALKTFVEEIVPDLCCDVPSLPKILTEELHPELLKLSQSGILKADQIKVVSGIGA
eukprot:TRINITY_DN10052_c0_g2_i2.p1 TRINITY_DN10052_c0_g2~~TRINITY_DN10052_c0_g2_i2.p1  ORF type:complete len:737 (-),score=221.30 TRINITY_DN10052_c0_g2_i2:424-2634(-)